jgi:hypothetical protein
MDAVEVHPDSFLEAYFHSGMYSFKVKGCPSGRLSLPATAIWIA